MRFTCCRQPRSTRCSRHSRNRHTRHLRARHDRGSQDPGHGALALSATRVPPAAGGGHRRLLETADRRPGNGCRAWRPATDCPPGDRQPARRHLTPRSVGLDRGCGHPGVRASGAGTASNEYVSGSCAQSLRRTWRTDWRASIRRSTPVRPAPIGAAGVEYLRGLLMVQRECDRIDAPEDVASGCTAGRSILADRVVGRAARLLARGREARGSWQPGLRWSSPWSRRLASG